MRNISLFAVLFKKYRFFRKGSIQFFLIKSKNNQANLDNDVSLADALAILQYVANAKKYPLTPVALSNADVYNRGDGITGNDALTIQKLDAKVISELPYTE